LDDGLKRHRVIPIPDQSAGFGGCVIGSSIYVLYMPVPPLPCRLAILSGLELE